MQIAVLDPPDAAWLKSIGLELHALGRGVGFYGYSPTLNRWFRDRGDEYEQVIVNGLWQYPGFADEEDHVR